MKHTFTIEHDRLIMRHIKGEFSVRTLERMTHSTRKTLETRCEELGVKLRPPSGSKLVTNEPPIRDVYICTTGDNDPLLAALRYHHPEKNK